MTRKSRHIVGEVVRMALLTAVATILLVKPSLVLAALDGDKRELVRGEGAGCILRWPIEVPIER